MGLRRSNSESGAGRPHAGVWLLLLPAAFGLSLLVPFYVVPAARAWRARSWPAVPCTILSSSVEADDGDSEAVYRVAVRFRYTFAGHVYSGGRYGFSLASSSGSDPKQRIVDRLPPGLETLCYVDPRDPATAVLNRGLGDLNRIVWLPLLFVAAGVALPLLILRGRRRKKASAYRGGAG